MPRYWPRRLTGLDQRRSARFEQLMPKSRHPPFFIYRQKAMGREDADPTYEAARQPKEHWEIRGAAHLPLGDASRVWSAD